MLEKMIKKSSGRNLNKTTPSSDSFFGVLILDERFFVQVMELIHLQEDLELDGFPSGVVLRCVCFGEQTHFTFCGPKIVEPEARTRLEVSMFVRPSKQCPEGLV